MRRILILAAIASATVPASAVLAIGPTAAHAVVADATPTWPIPSDAPGGPPPIPPNLPAATDPPPPADEIADPVTPAAVCGDWYQQSKYGDRWPAGSTWWEYRCSYDHAEYYPHPCDGPACDAVCYGYPYDCFSVSAHSADYFYWDGSNSVFYGEFYSYSIEDANGYSDSCAYWWDAPTRKWYVVDTPECPAPPPDNVAPTASFTPTCSGLDCTFNAGGSTDSDGTVDHYRWEFGDGTTGSGKTARHTYDQADSYTVTLTVTDNWGATGTDSKVVTPIGLTARGYKVKGRQKVDLSWNGSSGGRFDVYRDGSPLPDSPVQGTSYTDNIDRKGSGTYRYRVCEAETTLVCSDQVTVKFS